MNAHSIGLHPLPDGTRLRIRPIRPEDAGIEAAFVRSLSPRSRRFRFMGGLSRLTPEMIARFTRIDPEREAAFIGVVERDGRELQVGVARYTTDADGRTCEFALVVADEWHRRGIGSRLMETLMSAARDRGLACMHGEVLSDNHEMLALIRRLGFAARTCCDDPSVQQVARAL